ncbi:endonuclease/exonuclease/phosphatase family protein [Patescibacteria group bacterium]|nr:endonuclease/exonuclease/phosphatase family protein [Patescibacteria group bacterium]
MDFSYLTYNTLFNNGFENIKKIIDFYHPDVLCFQEIDTREDNLSKLYKYGYKLAGYENSFVRLGAIYGVATFYKENSLRHIPSLPIKKKNEVFRSLFYSILSFLLGYNRQKTFLSSNFIHLKTNKKITVCNTHLFVIGSNALRIRHINYVLKSLGTEKKQRFIISGDFNYLPYQRKKLESLMKKHQLKEATKNVGQTIKFSKEDDIFQTFGSFQKLSTRIVNIFFKALKIDYIFYKGLKLKKTERIEVRYSDHYPIISTFSL